MARETRRNLRPPPRVPFQRIEGLKAIDPKLGETLHRMQANVATATEQSRKQEDRGMKLVTCKLTASTTIEISHGLGREPKGQRVRESRIASPSYFVVRKTNRFLVIKGTMAANTSASVDLEVY